LTSGFTRGESTMLIYGVELAGEKKSGAGTDK
jgi:hypothetical protein